MRELGSGCIHLYLYSLARRPITTISGIQRLRTAGYKQSAEKWDSDSDSDESDEEDLKV